MRMLKWLAWILGGVVAIVLLGIAWLLFVFNPNHYKPQLEALVKDNTGRTLTLQGDLKLSLWPSLAVQLGHTTLGNAAGFGDEPMLAVDEVRLGVKLMPLLHQQVQVEAIELVAPQVLLIKRSDTENNWSDMGKQSTTEPTPAPESTDRAPLNLSIERVTITNAQVQYRDEAAHTQSTLQQFTLTTGKLASGEPIPLNASGVLAQTDATGEQALPFKLSTTITANLPAKQYTLAPLSLEAQFNRNGKLLPITFSAAEVLADLAAQTASANQVAIRSGDIALDLTLSAEKIMDAPTFSGSFTLAPVALRQVAAQQGIELPVTRDPKVFTQLSAAAKFAGTSTAMELSELKLTLDDTTLAGKVSVLDMASKALRFDLSVNQLNVDRYLAPASDAPATTTDTGPVKLPSEVIRGLDIVGQLRMQQAIISKVTLSDITLGLEARNNKLQLKPVNSSVYGGKFSGQVLLDASGNLPRLSVEEQVTGVNFAPLFKALYDTDRISGRGNVTLKLTGSGADSDALKRNLNGNVSFNVDEGAYEGIDLWWEIRRARALLRQQAVPAAADKPRTPFTALRGSGVISNGVFSTQDVNAAVQYLKVTGQGSADLVKSALDFRLQAAVMKFPSEERMAANVQDNPDDLVGLTIPISITGPFTAPKVRPDVAGLLKEKAKQELDKQKEKAKEKLQEKIDENKDKLKEKLQDKLKGLLGG